MNKAQTAQATEAAIEQPAFMVGNTFTPPKTPSPIQIKTLGDLAAVNSLENNLENRSFINPSFSFSFDGPQLLQMIQI